MPAHPSVSVIIPTRRPEAYLARSLASVAEQADEVVVVDNASAGDACRNICAEHGAVHLRQEENLGFAAAVNAGVAASRGDLIALLNDDAFADPGWVAHSAAVLADPTIGAVAPKLLFAWPQAIVRLEDRVHLRGRLTLPYGRLVTSLTVGDRDVLPHAKLHGYHPEGEDGFWTTGATIATFPLPDDRRDEVRVNGEPVEVEETFTRVNNAGTFLHPGGWCGDIGFGQRDDRSLDEAGDRFAACGAALVTRRATWDDVGELAPAFFTYYEDADWSWRLQLAGLRVRYEPRAVVRHVHAQTATEGSEWFTYFVSRNRLLCLARNAPSRVVARCLTLRPPLPPRVRRSLALRLPEALVQRRALQRRWTRAPEEVWAQWAGVGATSP